MCRGTERSRTAVSAVNGVAIVPPFGVQLQGRIHGAASGSLQVPPSRRGQIEGKLRLEHPAGLDLGAR